MKPVYSTAFHLTVLILCVCLLPSCKLIGSIVKIPVDVVKSVGRTAGIGNLTDDAPQPVKRGAADRQDPDAGEPLSE